MFARLPRDSQRVEERERWDAYFAAALTVYPLVEVWVAPALDFLSDASFWMALGDVAVVGGFLVQALYNRFIDSPE